MRSVTGINVVAGLCLAAVTATAADGWAIFDGGWRVSVGGVYSSPVKANLRVSPQAFASPRVPGNTAAEAQGQAKAARDTAQDPVTGKISYPSGAWINPHDAHDPGGVNGETWNCEFPATVLDGGKFVLGSYDYCECALPASDRYVSDESDGMPGINIELSRLIYADKEWKWGVEFAYSMAYFFQTDVLSANLLNENSKIGTWDATIDAPDTIADDWGWKAGHTVFGRGTYAGPGPVVDLGTLDIRHHGGPSEYVHLNGDYREFEFALCARPYYDVFDWLRINGTIGIVLSRGEFDLNVSMPNGSYGKDFTDWDFQGIAGIGPMFRYKDFTLAADFLVRFLQDDIEVDDPFVHGEIERSNWMLRVSLGYEF